MTAEVYSEDGKLLGTMELTEEVRMRAWQKGWAEVERTGETVRYVAKEGEVDNAGKDR